MVCREYTGCLGWGRLGGGGYGGGGGVGGWVAGITYERGEWIIICYVHGSCGIVEWVSIVCRLFLLRRYRQCCGARPFFTGCGSGSRYFFFTGSSSGSGSFSYKNRLRSSKKNVFAFTSSHRLRLRQKSTGSDRLSNTGYR